MQDIRCHFCECRIDEETEFIEIGKKKMCEECVDNIDSRELLCLLGISFTSVGMAEPETI